jgi:hypothetical protein
LSNLHQIGIGLKLYVDDYNGTFPPAALSQINGKIQHDSAQDVYYANSLGGKDTPMTVGTPYAATNRLLYWYVNGPEAWHCPADRGLDTLKPTAFDSAGLSYCFNGRPQAGDYGNADVDDPEYNLGLKKESWAPDPTRFIAMHEVAAYPWGDQTYGILVTQWHGAANPGKTFSSSTIRLDRDKLVAPVLFVDGHSKQCDFTANIKTNPRRPLEPGKDWMWYKPLR